MQRERFTGNETIYWVPLLQSIAGHWIFACLIKKSHIWLKSGLGIIGDCFIHLASSEMSISNWGMLGPKFPENLIYSQSKYQLALKATPYDALWRLTRGKDISVDQLEFRIVIIFWSKIVLKKTEFLATK